jgi:choline kinase
MEIGQLVVETITSPDPITEISADVRYDRSSMFSMNVEFEEVDEDLVLLYSDAVREHESYRAAWAPETEVYGQESCRQWRMVYRYYPTPASKASKALRLEMVAQ